MRDLKVILHKVFVQIKITPTRVTYHSINMQVYPPGKKKKISGILDYLFEDLTRVQTHL